MGQIIYYVAGQGTMNAEHACALGLAHVFGEGHCCCATIQNGPAGPGVVFAYDGPPQDSAYLGAAAVSIWKEALGAGHWIGTDPGNRPGPQDLARPKIMPGHAVLLGDGRQWTVPIVRYLDGSTSLPRRLGWDGKEWSPAEVVGDLAELFEQLCRCWDVLIRSDRSAITLTDEIGTAVRLLGLNYRIGPAEVDALGLLDTHTEVQVLLAGMDWPAVEAYVAKKGGLVTPSAEPGQPGDSPATAPASPT